MERLQNEAEQAQALRAEAEHWKRQASQRAGLEDEVDRWKKEATRLEIEMQESAATWHHEVLARHDYQSFFVPMCRLVFWCSCM